MNKVSLLAVTLTVTAVLGLWVHALEATEAGERRNVTLNYGAGKSLPLTVVLPAGYSPDIQYPLVFALPPGPGTPDMVNAFLGNYWLEQADLRGYILVSPAILGPSLETSAGEVVDAVFDWVGENLSYDAARVTLAGQSNGGIGAFHVARTDPDRFGSIVVMPGGYGAAGDLAQLGGKPVLLAVGERDTQWVVLTQRTRDLLVLAGAEPRIDVVPGAGHVFPYPSDTLFDWIEQSHPE